MSQATLVSLLCSAKPHACVPSHQFSTSKAASGILLPCSTSHAHCCPASQAETTALCLWCATESVWESESSYMDCQWRLSTVSTSISPAHLFFQKSTLAGHRVGNSNLQHTKKEKNKVSSRYGLMTARLKGIPGSCVSISACQSVTQAHSLTHICTVCNYCHFAYTFKAITPKWLPPLSV